MTVTDLNGSIYRTAQKGSISVSTPPKRRVFISYHHFDQVAAQRFVEDFGGPEGVFTYRGLGLSLEEDIVDSTDPEYVMRCIRERHLGDSTVTIVLIGRCTHGRRYVDWEIRSSLRAGTGLPNGLLGILLPEARLQNTPNKNEYPALPPRFKANFNGADKDKSYARYSYYPTSATGLRDSIENAFSSRTSKATLIDNTLPMMGYNRCCQDCGVTH